MMLPATAFKKVHNCIKKSIPVFSKRSADSTEGTTKPSEVPVPRCLLLNCRAGGS